MTTLKQQNLPMAPPGTSQSAPLTQHQTPAAGGYIRDDSTSASLESGSRLAPFPTTAASALQAALLRPYLTTEETATILRVQPQTLRKAWSQRGAYGSLKPFKIKGVRRLYWPTEGVRRMVEEGA